MTDTARGWGPFLAGILAFAAIMLGATVPTPIYPLYSAAYGFSELTITVIFGVYAAGVITALLLTGPWSDQIGRRPILLAGLALSGVSSVVFLFAGGLPLILVGRVLSGVSVGLYTAAATVAVGEMAPEGRDRAGTLGATAANMGGLGLGPIFGALAILALPRPLHLPFLAHLALVALAFACLWPTPEPGRPADRPRLRPQGLAVPAQVRPVFVPAAICAFAGFMICGFLTSVTPAYLGEVLGYDGRHLLIGTVTGLVFLMSCIGQSVEDLLPRGRRLPIGMALLLAGLLAITAALALRSLALLVAAIVVAGIGHGIAFRGGLTGVAALSPAGRKSAVTSTYFTVAYVAISIPVVTVGFLSGPLGLVPASIGFAAVASALCAIALVLILRRDRAED